MRRLCAALAIAMLLAACTRAGEGSGSSPAGGGRHSWTEPGLLRLGGLSDPDNLSPLIGEYGVDVDISMFWAGYLFNYDDHDQLVPELAVAVPTLANGAIAKDGLSITYHLRRGVLWQDGAPFSADDVVFSWHAVMNPNTNVQTRDGYDDIRSIDEPDRYTVVVHLIRPYAPFVNTFFTMGGQPYPVYPKHLLARYHDLNQIPYNSKPIGTGPFIVSEWHRGQTLRMTANPHYWRGPPKLREVDYHIIPDENTLVTGMRTHEIDLWTAVTATNYPVVSRIPGTRVVLTPFTQYSLLGFNTRRPNVSDVRVRRALVYATDRKQLIDDVAFGVNILGEGDQPAFSWAHDPRLRSVPFDPARARAMLDAAGWKTGPDGIRIKDGRRLRLEYATTTGSVLANRIAVLLQAQWRNVGVQLDIKSYASAMYFAGYASGGILQTGRFDVEASSWLNGIDPDDSTLFTCAAVPSNGQNAFRFCDPQLDAQERIALGTFDQAVRKRAYARIQEILVDQVPQITTWFQRRFDVVNVDLRNYRPSHVITTFWNTWEYSI
jgi:peptide/nickel transport system substrate-binding protein